MTFNEKISSTLVSRVDRFRFQSLLSATRRLRRTYAGPKLIDLEAAPATKVLVLSPHEDDEIIGCGGSLRRFVEKGARVKVVYMTDGSNGGAGSAPDDRALIRQQEAERGLNVLGIVDRSFLEYPDGSLVSNVTSINEVSGILGEYGPNVLFIPYYLDSHPDHAETARIASKALGRYNGDIICYSYEVWTALSPNVIVDVTDIMDLKMSALREHASQVAQLDYPEKVKGLNAYRSMFARPNVTHCEAFIRQSRKEYLAMISGSN